jgi:hypothetical protein
MYEDMMNMLATADQSVSERDFQLKQGAARPSNAELILAAARASGRSAFQIGREFRALSRGVGKIELFEYVRYGLYDDKRFTSQQKADFIGIAQHWPITFKCSDKSWYAATEDKFLADTILRAHGMAVPETVAVIDQGGRSYGLTPKLGDADALAGFLRGAEFPLFGKVLRGICGFGAFLATGADETHIHLKGRAPVTYAAFLAELGKETAYVVQRVLDNHAQIAPYCSATATVRMVNLVRGGTVSTPNAVIKLPGGDNVIDAFWRPDNLACDIDPATGIVRRIVAKEGLGLVEPIDHPAYEALVGKALPHWDRLVELNREAALLFAPVRYQSFDIALTDNGPVIVEINTGSGFDLPQNAAGKGMLTPEVRDFFRSCGCPGF